MPRRYVGRRSRRRATCSTCQDKSAATTAIHGTRACSEFSLVQLPPHSAPTRNERQIKLKVMALLRFAAISRRALHRTQPEVASRRLPVVIAELNGQGPTRLKLVFCRAATKEIMGTTLASGRRAPTATRAARITSSNAWHSKVARNIFRSACTPRHVATATPREEATIGGRCRTACDQWPWDASTDNKTKLPVCVFAKT
jgi:hypothetical protein